jgi:hypothetical protein
VVVFGGESMFCPLLIYFIEDIEMDVLLSELASCIIITANNQKKYECPNRR